MKVTTEQIKALSQIFALSGIMIEAIDSVTDTPLHNTKLQKKLVAVQELLKPIFALFHEAKAQNENDTLEAQSHFVLLQKHYDNAVKSLYDLDLNKVHLAGSLLEHLQENKIEIQHDHA